jgi:hypothetical protein
LASTFSEHMTTTRSFVMPSKKTTMVGYVLTRFDQNQGENTLLWEAQNQKRKVINHKMMKSISRSITLGPSISKLRKAKKKCFDFLSSRSKLMKHPSKCVILRNTSIYVVFKGLYNLRHKRDHDSWVKCVTTAEG